MQTKRPARILVLSILLGSAGAGAVHLIGCAEREWRGRAAIEMPHEAAPSPADRLSGVTSEAAFEGPSWEPPSSNEDDDDDDERFV